MKRTPTTLWICPDWATKPINHSAVHTSESKLRKSCYIFSTCPTGGCPGPIAYDLHKKKKA